MKLLLEAQALLFFIPLKTKNCSIFIVMTKSYAKINFILKILDRRGDGYHNLLSLFQRVDLYDELLFEPSEKGISLESNISELPLDQTNLVYQAAEILLKKTNKNNGLKVFIQKNIPIGAGLGGGSSNAASTLLELNRIWDLGYSIEELAEMGALLGSDVPFFCYQVPAAWVRGRGEQVSPYSFSPGCWILLVFPGFSIQTREAYHLLDLSRRGDKRGLTKKGNNNTISSFQTLKEVSLLDHLENDFESVLFAQYPVYKKLKARLFEQKAVKVMLSGSGSTLFGIFFEERKARSAEENLKKEFQKGFVRAVRCL